MSGVPALLIAKDAVKRDAALQPGARGARKLLVTDLFAAKELEASEIEWLPPALGEKCPVQVMQDCEIAVFNYHAVQDRHFHKLGTEIYIVIDGEMVIEIEGDDYRLLSGDMIVVNPGTVHEVKPNESKFFCRVVTLNCGGSQDKYIVERGIL